HERMVVIVSDGQRFTIYFFFFSSRRRHTRSKRDWSSDVCSSDLEGLAERYGIEQALELDRTIKVLDPERDSFRREALLLHRESRSEERRVGKEWRARGSAGQSQEKGRTEIGGLSSVETFVPSTMG